MRKHAQSGEPHGLVITITTRMIRRSLSLHGDKAYIMFVFVFSLFYSNHLFSVTHISSVDMVHPLPVPILYHITVCRIYQDRTVSNHRACDLLNADHSLAKTSYRRLYFASSVQSSVCSTLLLTAVYYCLDLTTLFDRSTVSNRH